MFIFGGCCVDIVFLILEVFDWVDGVYKVVIMGFEIIVVVVG